MSLSDPRINFGVHSLTPVNRTTGLPYGILQVLGDANLSLSAESVDLFGGSSLFPWASEVTQINSQMVVTVKATPDFLFELYMGAAVTTTAASATDGTVSALTNYVGTTMFSSTGLATATLKAGEAASLKFGTYMVVYVSATTVDVYAVTDLQFTRGDDLTFQDDTLKITSAALTITTDTAVEIPNTGIELTGGSGTIAITSGDVAIFTVAPPHNGLSDIAIGQSGISFPEHELYLVAKERASGEMAIVRCYKAVGVSGMILPFAERDFVQFDITIKLLRDTTQDKVAEIRFLKA